jgi:hypothetical protein
MVEKSSSIGSSFDRKDVLSGMLMIAAAATFAWFILRPGGLSLGSARAMGPGYFPLMISMILAALGLIMVVGAFGRGTSETHVVPFRSLALISLGPISFGLLIRPIGFIAAVSVMVLISAWASFRMTWKTAILTTAFMTVFSVLLFYYLLKMPITLWGDGSILPFQ